MTNFGLKSTNLAVGSRAIEVAMYATNYFVEGFYLMLKYYVKATETLKRLRTDKDGVVSFEYVIVAVCIVTAVLAAFGTTTGSGIGNALAGGIAKITTAFNAVP
jgi:pilus assembly protein Flp/PilA